MKNAKNTLLSFISYLILGIALGILSKYLDTVAVDGHWLSSFQHYFANLFTRLGIWVLIATAIAAYSKTTLSAALNTFIFFVGMLISYYVYSAYLFGFFPMQYLIFWGGIALVSPLLAMIVWSAKHKEQLAYYLPALPMGLMLSLSLGMGLFYVDISYVEELIMFIVLGMIFYRSPKQIVIVAILSFIMAWLIELLSPFHF